MNNKTIKAFKKWVLKELIERDLTITRFAKDLNYSRAAVSAAINQGKNPHVISAIAQKLNHDPEKHSPIPTSPARAEVRYRVS